MADAHDILGSMGVVVPHKIVKLSKPPSAFIAEGGGSLAAWQEAKLQQRAGSSSSSAAAGSAARTGKRMHASISRSERSSSVARSVGRSSDADAAPAGGAGAGWRAHAHPMQRSHFSTSHPSSLTLDSDTAPVSLNAKELANHRRVSNRAPAPPSPPHPLEAHHYGNAHATRREPLAPVNCNSSAAGAPSGKVKRQPIPSDVDSIKQKPVEYTQPVAQRVGAPKIWLEERDRKERLREQQQQHQHAVVGRERVLSRGSPARERVEAEAGTREVAAAAHAPVGHHQAAARLWTAQRQKRDDDATAPALARPLVHMHKKLWEPEVACSPRRTGEVGVQKSALQRQWGEQGWWSADAASPRSRVEVKPEYQAPSASAEPQPSFGVPNYARAGYEEIQRTTTHRRSPSPSATLRTTSRPPLYRQWKP